MGTKTVQQRQEAAITTVLNKHIKTSQRCFIIIHSGGILFTNGIYIINSNDYYNNNYNTINNNCYQFHDITQATEASQATRILSILEEARKNYIEASFWPFMKHSTKFLQDYINCYKNKYGNSSSCVDIAIFEEFKYTRSLVDARVLKEVITALKDGIILYKTNKDNIVYYKTCETNMDGIIMALNSKPDKIKDITQFMVEVQTTYEARHPDHSGNSTVAKNFIKLLEAKKHKDERHIYIEYEAATDDGSSSETNYIYTNGFYLLNIKNLDYTLNEARYSELQVMKQGEGNGIIKIFQDAQYKKDECKDAQFLITKKYIKEYEETVKNYNKDAHEAINGDLILIGAHLFHLKLIKKILNTIGNFYIYIRTKIKDYRPYYIVSETNEANGLVLPCRTQEEEAARYKAILPEASTEATAAPQQTNKHTTQTNTQQTSEEATEEATDATVINEAAAAQEATNVEVEEASKTIQDAKQETTQEAQQATTIQDAQVEAIHNKDIETATEATTKPQTVQDAKCTEATAKPSSFIIDELQHFYMGYVTINKYNYYTYKHFINNYNCIIITNNIRYWKAKKQYILIVSNNEVVFLKEWQVKQIKNEARGIHAYSVRLNKNYYKPYKLDFNITNIYSSSMGWDDIVKLAKKQDATNINWQL